MSPDRPSQPPSMPVYGLGPPISDDEYVLFRNYIADLCGISIDPEKKYFLESRLAPLLAESASTSYADFYAKATVDSRRWRERIIECVMTNETLWFRDPPLWSTLREVLLPNLVIHARKQQRKVRIWSAGCSTGQEPYSLAMLIDQSSQQGRLLGAALSDFDILATDISRAALMLARAGRYDPVSMRRGLDSEWESCAREYFTTLGNVSTIADDIRTHVRFEKLPLQNDFSVMGQFDLVLLRYVAIYFSAEFKRSFFRRLRDVIHPGGALILGSTEMLAADEYPFSPERQGRIHIYRASER